MDAYERESRESLGKCNLVCIARQNVWFLLRLIQTPNGYAMASNVFMNRTNTLFDKVFSGEYPEYDEFSAALKIVLDYLKTASYNEYKLIEIADTFPGTYFYNLVHNLE